MPFTSRLAVSATLLSIAAISNAQAADLDLQIHGYASQGAFMTTANNFAANNSTEGSFAMTDVGINVTAQPADRVTLGIAFSAYDLGRGGDLQPQIDWAYGRYQLPEFSSNVESNVVFGRLKFQHGLYNDYRDLDMTRTSVFLPFSVYAVTGRDIWSAINGAQLNVSANSGMLGSFDFSYSVGHQNVLPQGHNDDIFWGAHESVPGLWTRATIVNKLVTYQRLDEGALTWNTPIDGLRLKGSILHIDDLRVQSQGTVAESVLPAGTSFNIDVHLPHYLQYVGSLEYVKGDWTLVSEYARTYFKYLYELDIPTFPAFSGTTRVYSVTDSAYVSTAYRFDPSWEGLACFQALNSSDENRATNDQARWFRGYSVALRWDVTDHFLLKGEAMRAKGAGTMLFAKDNPDGIEKWWNLFAVKATFDF